MSEGVPEKRESVQSIDRAAEILRCFDTGQVQLGISQVARKTGLSTSTVHRLLRALQDNGLVAQREDRRYVLGPLLVRLVRSGVASLSLRDAAVSSMTKLRDETDETVGLHALLPTHERAVVDQVESRQPLRRTYTEFGMPIPLTLGAPGKAILAYLSASAQQNVLNRRIPQVTPSTPTDPAVLRRQLAEIRNSWFAVSYSERTMGIRSIAAGIVDGLDRAVGAVSLSAPALRMPPERMAKLGPRVAEAAWEASYAMGATKEGFERMLREAAWQ